VSVVEDVLNADADRWLERHREGIVRASPSFARASLRRNGGTYGRRPLRIFAVPRFIAPSILDGVTGAMLRLDALLNRAVAYGLADPDTRRLALAGLPLLERLVVQLQFGRGARYGFDHTLRWLESALYYSRLDQLIGGPATAENQGFVPIEMNSSCPEGLYYMDLMQRIYADAAGLPPPVSVVGYIGTALAELVRESDEARPAVGLVTYAGNPITSIELPRLAQRLAVYDGRMDYVYGTVDELSVDGTGWLHLRGRRLAGLWRNWGVRFGAGTNVSHCLKVLTSPTPMLNPAPTLIRGLKLFWAILSSDEGFRATHCSSDERAFLDGLLPPTYALRTRRDLRAPLERHGRCGLIYKPLYGSSGHGVTRDLARVEAALDDGQPQVAQRLVEPATPTVKTYVHDADGSLGMRLTFGDVNPYLLHLPSGVRRAGPIIARAKSRHPINVAQGGALGLAYPMPEGV
jgi:hypothetical protein